MRRRYAVEKPAAALPASGLPWIDSGVTGGYVEPDVPADQVRAQLAGILSSTGFVSSQRLCRFLQFIVERTLEDDAQRLKEYVVAIEVFDRNADYDPTSIPSFR